MVIVRPTVLIAESVEAEAISSRELVVETAKFNVITAYTSLEAVEQFRKFPSLDVVILHTMLDGYQSAAAAIKEERNVPIVQLRHNDYEDLKLADYRLSSHNPEELVSFLREKYGDPRRPARS